MLLKVNPHKIEIDKSPVNEREINISKCQFEFADEITNDYVKEAYFTFEGTTYKQIIVNNKCSFPSEVLAEKGQVEIGVVAYIVENETELKRYNPSPAYFNTWVGSLKDDYENSEPITPTDKEQIESAIAGLQSDVADLEEDKQDKLVSGENIKTINGESLLGEGDIEIDQDFVKDDNYVHTDNNYTDVEKEKLANLENYDDTSIKNDISGIKDEQGTQNGNILQNKTDIEALGESLTNYSLITETGSQIALNINSSNYQMTAILKNKNGNVIYTSNVIDLPIESMIINVAYDSTTKEIVFTLQNGNVLRVSVADLVSGLQTEITSENMLSADLVDDTNTTHKFTSSGEKFTWNAKYDKPSGGIPKTDLDSGVQTSLGKADTSLQEHQDISGKEDKTNKVTNISSSSTDMQYPSAKCVYDSQTEQDTNISALQNLVTQLPRVTGTGTNLSLNPTLNYKIMKSDLKGNSSQDGTPTTSTPLPIKVVTGENSLIISNSDNTQSQTYSLSFGNMEFCSTPDGSIRDYIYGSPNNWYKKQLINKLTVDSSFGTSAGGEFNTMKNNGYICRYTTNYPAAINSNRALIYCNILKGANNTLWNGANGEGIQLGTSNSSIYMAINFNTIENYYGSTLTSQNYGSAFVSYLISKNVTIYYPTNSPTDIQITDTTLIEQLNNIYNNVYSYNGTTNITTTCETGNEQMYLDFEALMDLNNLVARIETIESEV